MNPNPDSENTVDVDKAFAERLALLPPVLQQAIQSADLEKHLRALADSHKLHLDQWELLQNEVKLALLGFEDAEKLPENIENEIGLDGAAAQELAGAINDEIFEPIRQELERALAHPGAQTAHTDEIEKARQAAIATAKAAGEGMPAPTPPNPAPDSKIERAPISDTYKPTQSSTERKDVHNDPYRESPA